jgi:serine/threonine protein kinase
LNEVYVAKYIEISLLGSGGFGDVYLCKRDTDDRIFAKKKLRDDVDDAGRKRFSREVRLISALDHPHIIRVVAKRLSDAPYFYIMPLYKRSLRSELPTLVENESRIYPIFSSILEGVEYAHKQGVIRRRSN